VTISAINDSTTLLKWPGGKRALLKHILAFAPCTFNNYYEPFVGGGALFFALRPNQAILADKNTELINCYKQVRDYPNAVIAHLSELRNTKEDYYTIRESIPSDDPARAARFIYLMTLSFNGLHRVNLQGKFNVPYGYKEYLNPCDATKILHVSTLLSSAELLDEDFETSVSKAKAGDFIYFDPPYTVAHSNNGFLKYNARIFSWNDQIRLATIALNLAERGCKVLISNADHPSILELYRSFRMYRITRSSAIAASGEYRRQITECIFYNEE
jgi:DNA adenine methylase